MAEQTTREQSAQNQRVSRAHTALAQGSKELVQADAQARRDFAQLQDKLRQDQANLGHQRDAIASERRELAAEREQSERTCSFLTNFGIVVVCLAPLILAGFLLLILNRDRAQAETADVLVDELVHSLDGEPLRPAPRMPGQIQQARNLPAPLPPQR